MKTSLAFRLWFYFRNGWSVYFAFAFAAVNTLTVTYFLAIENYPILSQIFPSFIQYVSVVTLVGIPILTLIGYLHFKKSKAYKSESEVGFESNPYYRRLIMNSEIMLPIQISILELLTKLSTKNELDENQIKEIENMKKQLAEYIENMKIDRDVSQLEKETINKFRNFRQK